MRTSIRLIALLGVLALALAGCGTESGGGGGGGANGNEVDFGPTNFVQTSVTITAGQAVHFVDPQSSGGAHNICVGTSGQCDTSGKGPSALQKPGMMLSPGDTKDVTFDTAGTYTITCTFHPSMLLTVTVQ